MYLVLKSIKIGNFNFGRYLFNFKEKNKKMNEFLPSLCRLTRNACRDENSLIRFSKSNRTESIC